MPNNKILNASNDPILVTTLLANNSVSTLEGAPLGTVADATTGEIILKVSVRENSVAPPPPSGGTFDTTFLNTSTSGTIPASTTLGWSITAYSGTVTVRGVTLPVGVTVRGGGYAGYAMASSVAYDATGGVALVVYDEIV
jgi:hypothetical protein